MKASLLLEPYGMCISLPRLVFLTVEWGEGRRGDSNTDNNDIKKTFTDTSLG